MRRLLRNVALGVGLVALVPVAIIAVVAIAGEDDEPVIVSATTVAAVATPGVVMVSPECGAAFDAVIDQLDVEDADPRIDQLTDQFVAAQDDATRERLVDEQIAISDEYAEAHDAVLVQTTAACTTAAEWMQAARGQPRAVGKVGAEFVADLDLGVTCMFAEAGAPACVDAIATGRLVACETIDAGACLPGD